MQTLTPTKYSVPNHPIREDECKQYVELDSHSVTASVQSVNISAGNEHLYSGQQNKSHLQDANSMLLQRLCARGQLPAFQIYSIL